MKNITCYGAGVIGTAWGVVYLKAGFNVTMVDTSDEILANTKTNLTNILGYFQSKELMTAEQVADCLTRVSFTTDPKTGVENADLIQESVFENLELKQQTVEIIEKFCKPDTLICSSTSGLPVSKIAANAIHKERILGAHPYNPVYLIPLVELTKGDFGSQENVEKAKEFYAQIGKEPIILNMDCPGFVCNRVQVAVLREVYDLVNRGVVSVEDADKAVTYSVGLRWAIIGPHLVNQVGGGAHGFSGLLTHLGPAFTYWINDMADWKVVPPEYLEKGQKGIDEAMANRAPGTGQTNAELLNYMNNGVIEILKYLGKL